MQIEEQWLNISELSEYLPEKPARATIYTWVQKGSIPFHKGGKKLMFLKSEIDNWLKNERKLSVDTTETDTQDEVFISVMKAFQLNKLSENISIPGTFKKIG